MVSWESSSVSKSFRQHCRQALGNFLRAFHKDQPWWISLTKAVNDDDKTWLNCLLGFDQAISVEFLISAGLIKVGHSRNPTAVIVVKSEWDKFILEEKLGDLMETVNKTSISGQRHFFINIGDKKRLNHRPIDQFSGKVKQQYFGAYVSTRQRKLHKELSEMLLSLRTKNLEYMDAVDDKESSEDEDESTDEPVLQVFPEDHKEIDKERSPILFEMFTGKESVPIHILNALFCELVNVLKKKDNSVDFIFGNDKWDVPSLCLK